MTTQTKTNIREYIETRKDYRLQAKYDGRGTAYFQQVMSLTEALELFEALGKIEQVGQPNTISECVRGGQRVVWDRLSGWSILEKKIKQAGKRKIKSY